MESIALGLLERFDEADTNMDGLLSLNEAQGVKPNLTAEQFNTLDNDRDGFLSTAELDQFVNSMTGCFGPGSDGGVGFLVIAFLSYFALWWEEMLRLSFRFMGLQPQDAHDDT